MTYTQQSARPITASDLVLVLNSAGLWKYATRSPTTKITLLVFKSV